MNLKDWKILNKKVNILKEKYKIYKNRNCADEIELREIILDVLSWIEICIKNDDFSNNSSLISGFRYINNKKKHTDQIYEYNFITKGLFPSIDLYPSSEYPSDFKITWCKINEESNPKWVNQWNNYKKNLENANVINTIDLLLNTLEEHYKLK